MSAKEWSGVLAACASSALGGTAVVATRALAGAIDPLALAALRYLIGAVCLLPLAVAGGAWPARRDWPAVVGLGLLFFALFPYLFTLSLALTTAARGALALSTLPLVTLAVAALLGAERLTASRLAGVLVALGGVGVALSGGAAAGTPSGAWRGDLVMVAAAAAGGLYNVRSRVYLSRYPAVVFTALAMAAGAVALAGLAGARGAFATLATLGRREWGAVVYLGTVGAALVFWLWSKGLERTTATRVAITVTVNPVSATTLGALLLGEPATPRLAGGLAAVACGIWLAARR